MHPRHPITRLAVAIAAVAALSSCAHAPRVLEENGDVLSLRQDYLRAHPDGRYNEFIARGEVVRGMTYLEVLASWGYPDARARVPERSLEYWRYLAADEASGDWIQYVFLFEESTLSEWEMSRHASKGRAMEQFEFRDPTRLPDERSLPPEARAAVKH